MNKEECPFLTGNERMNLVISESYILRTLVKQFELKSDQPYLFIFEEEKEKERKSSVTAKTNAVKKSTMAAAELAHHFLDDLGCIVC